MTLTDKDLESFVKHYFNIHPDSPTEMSFPIRLHTLILMAWRVYEMGIQEGMRREHAMWVLAKIGQEIEEKDEYCPHGIRHERHCKSCECIEQAEMRSEME